MKHLPKYCNADDRVVAQCLINELLAAECTITINDGEEDCLEQSSNLTTILSAMSSTGEDVVIPFDADGNELGWFHLIYHNGSEGEPMVCCSDYLANQFCECVWRKIDAQLGVSACKLA